MTEQDPTMPGRRPDRGSWPLGPTHVLDDAAAGFEGDGPQVVEPVPAPVELLTVPPTAPPPVELLPVPPTAPPPVELLPVPPVAPAAPVLAPVPAPPVTPPTTVPPPVTGALPTVTPPTTGAMTTVVPERASGAPAKARRKGGGPGPARLSPPQLGSQRPVPPTGSVPVSTAPQAPPTGSVPVSTAPATPPSPSTGSVPLSTAPAVPPAEPPAVHATPARGLAVTAAPVPRPRTDPDPRRGARLVAVAAAALVVVAAVVTTTWVVRRGDDTALPGPLPTALHNTTEFDTAPVTPTPTASATPSLTASTPATTPVTSAPPTSGASGPAPVAGPKPGGTSGRAPAAPAAPGGGAAAPAGTVQDDFNGTALAGRWSTYSSRDDNGGIKSPGQVRVRNGELQIVGQGRNASGKGNLSGGLCWCSSSGERLYGVWKVRAKFDAGAGYGQGIGLWPASGNGTRDGHITIGMSNGANKSSSWHAVNAPGGSAKGGSTGGDFTTWHVYAVEWRSSYVRISIDGKVVFDTRSDAPGLAIPHTRQHLILQQDLGPGSGIPAPNGGTPSQVIMHIDWVSYAP